ncbi:MAG: PEP-CTERM sorting domain-containing protein [Azoarcus sp.]|jgi:hypothetical protein|nr:PEP-CTERM sorting domain-containing protein [Azoarcus sp.]
MLNSRFRLLHAFVFPLAAASLVFGPSAAFASSLIGTRNTSMTFSVNANDIFPNRTAYIVGLTADEASRVTASNYLDIIRPYDAEKTGVGDTNLCWAAAAANMLAYTGWGNVNGFKTEDDIFSYYRNSFTDMGGDPDFALEWFAKGSYTPIGWNEWAQPTTADAGNFWPNANISFGYIEYSDWSSKDLLLPYLQDGYAVALTIGLYDEDGERTGGHAVTVWGATYDNNYGKLMSLLVSDSDNHYGGGVDAPDTLNEFFLGFTPDGNYYTLDSNGFRVGRWEGFAYLAMAVTAVPEPPAFLLFGLGIISMALMGRRKAPTIPK